MLYKSVLVFISIHVGAIEANTALADLGGAKCTDSKAVHRETQCSCSDKRDLPQSATVRYVEKADTIDGAGYVPKALPSRCDLPVYIQCQFDVDPVAYTANYPFTDHGAFYQFAHRTGHLFGTHHMTGSAFSSFTHNATKVNPKDPTSVPRNFYVQEYVVNSAAAYKWWEWYLGNYFAVGPDYPNAMAVNSNARIAFAGMCEEYSTKLYALSGVQAYQSYGNIIEVPFMLGDSYARPLMPLDTTQPPMTFTTPESMTDKPSDWIISEAYPRDTTNRARALQATKLGGKASRAVPVP